MFRNKAPPPVPPLFKLLASLFLSFFLLYLLLIHTKRRRSRCFGLCFYNFTTLTISQLLLDPPPPAFLHFAFVPNPFQETSVLKLVLPSLPTPSPPFLRRAVVLWRCGVYVTGRVAAGILFMKLDSRGWKYRCTHL